MCVRPQRINERVNTKGPRPHPTEEGSQRDGKGKTEPTEGTNHTIDLLPGVSTGPGLGTVDTYTLVFPVTTILIQLRDLYPLIEPNRSTRITVVSEEYYTFVHELLPLCNFFLFYFCLRSPSLSMRRHPRPASLRDDDRNIHLSPGTRLPTSTEDLRLFLFLWLREDPGGLLGRDG